MHQGKPFTLGERGWPGPHRGRLRGSGAREIGKQHPAGNRERNATIFAYDANGNTTSGGGTSVTYDGENRLVQLGTSSFVYAPDGSRLKKTVNGTTTLYIDIGDDWEVTGGVSTYYLPGDAVMTGAVVSWLHRDVLGSVRLTTNAAGATVQRAQYRPYGERLETIATQMTSKGFIGERNDETGLVYLHARYLNPYLGRFITPDPSPDPTAPGVGPDRYAYAGDNPIGNLDPSGLEKYTLGIGLIGIIGVVGIIFSRCENCGANLFIRKFRDRLYILPFIPLLPEKCPNCGHLHS